MLRNELGKKIRKLREQRSWTQSLLARSSGVSLRTIQRLEKEGNGSPETLLSVASALNIDVKKLTGIVVSNQPAKESDSIFSIRFNDGIWITYRSWFKRRVPIWGKIMSVLGFSLIAVPLLFLLTGIVKYNLGFDGVPDLFSMFRSNDQLRYVFDNFSPLIFMGSLTGGFLINLLPFLNIDIKVGKTLSLAVEYQGDLKNSVVIIIALSVALLMLLYGLVENGILVL